MIHVIDVKLVAKSVTETGSESKTQGRRMERLYLSVIYFY